VIQKLDQNGLDFCPFIKAKPLTELERTFYKLNYLLIFYSKIPLKISKVNQPLGLL